MTTNTTDTTGRSPNQLMRDADTDWSQCLVAIAEHGDTEAFQRLFNRFAPLIKAFARKAALNDGTDHLAEELVQETMIKVWGKAGAFDPEKAGASTWIFTIARNTRIDLLRKHARHDYNKAGGDRQEDGFDVDDIWIENEDEDLFNQLARQRSSERLHESMRELPDEQSFILKKVYLEDKSHSEIADELSIPLGTVKSRVRLALKKLRLTIDR